MLLGHAEFRRIDEIVRTVDPEHRDIDLREVRRRIVIARAVQLVDLVISIGIAGGAGGIAAAQRGLGLFAGRVFGLQRQGIGTRDHRDVARGAQAAFGCRGVIAIIPQRIGLDRVDRHLAPHPVAPGDLHRVAGKRGEPLGKAGAGGAPDKGVHAAHRSAQDQLKLFHAQAFGQHALLAGDHVGVIVAREGHLHAVAGLGAFAVADIVRQDHIVLGDVERLARAIQFVSKLRAEELVAAAASAVKHHHRVFDLPGRVLFRGAKRGDVDLDVHFAALGKGEVLQDNIAFGRFGTPVFRVERRGDQGEQGQDEFAHDPKLAEQRSGSTRPTGRNPVPRPPAPLRAPRRSGHRPWPRIRAAHSPDCCRPRSRPRPGRAACRP